MNKWQQHRGPDDAGIYQNDDLAVSLGHRRLSILDVAGGSQPMANAAQTIWIVYNGEIYNSPQLRKQLENAGHRFKTVNSDTEVLINLYEDLQEQMFGELNGMFAFAILDLEKKHLLLARDRMGIKPLYYSARGAHFSFASELKALKGLPWLSDDICFESAYHYLSLQFIPAPRTAYQDILKLPAGHYLSYDLETADLAVKRYWTLAIKPDPQLSLPECLTGIQSEFKAAVQRWTLSDVPIACSLSGGLDSAAIVGVLAKSQGQRVKTYTLGFKGDQESPYSELPLARKVAKLWDTEHHEIVLDEERLLDSLDDMVFSLDEPYGGGLPSWYIYEAISQDCKVALTGSGGDELFGNYGKWNRYENLLPLRWIDCLRQVKMMPWRHSLRAAYRFPHGFFYHRYLTDAVKDSFFRPASELDPVNKTEALIDNRWKSATGETARDIVAQVDFEMQLPEEFLYMTDRFSMAHSLEARVPFLDHELIEYIFTIPAALRTRTGDPKYLLRKAVEPWLPAELLSAPKKGFILPLSIWTRSHLRTEIEALFTDDFLRIQGIFERSLADDIIQPHLTGQRDYTQQVWTLFMFQKWYSQYVGV